MELRKTSENVSRTFDADGKAQERVESANFDIIDCEGKVVGNANIGIGYGNANIGFSGFDTIEEGEARLREIFAVSE